LHDLAVAWNDASLSDLGKRRLGHCILHLLQSVQLRKDASLADLSKIRLGHPCSAPSSIHTTSYIHEATKPSWVKFLYHRKRNKKETTSVLTSTKKSRRKRQLYTKDDLEIKPNVISS
jgi:hypothetical protein